MIVCSVGTTDPWNASGLGLDLRVARDLGAILVSVVAGISAQDARGLRRAIAIEPAIIEAQFDALDALEIDAYRIGALLDAPSVEIIAHRMANARAPIVYDPALGPTAGGRFADDGTIERIRSGLVPRCTLVTPNLAEAEALLAQPLSSAQIEHAARSLVDAGARAALVKGSDKAGVRAVDVLAMRDGEAVAVHRFEDERLDVEMRGTGCLLAFAIAVSLARGDGLVEAVQTGRSFVREKMTRAIKLGSFFIAD